MKISFSVIFIHFLLTFVFMNFHPQTKDNKPAQLKVHHISFQPKEIQSETIVIQPQEETIIEEIVAPQVVEETPKENPVVEEKPAPSPKKEIVKKDISKKPEPKKVPPKTVQPQPQKKVAAVKKQTASPPQKKASSPKPNPNREKLYALMQESLKKLDKPRTTHSNSSKPIEQNDLPALASEALKFEATYQDSLVSLLEDRLEFPEKGKVKIKLTIKKDGNFKNLEILQSASDKNAKYLQAALQNMIFPSFQKFFPKEDAHTFSITLTSEKSH